MKDVDKFDFFNLTAFNYTEFTSSKEYTIQKWYFFHSRAVLTSFFFLALLISLLSNGLCGFGICDATAICYELLLLTVIFRWGWTDFPLLILVYFSLLKCISPYFKYVAKLCHTTWRHYITNSYSHYFHVISHISLVIFYYLLPLYPNILISQG